VPDGDVAVGVDDIVVVEDVVGGNELAAELQYSIWSGPVWEKKYLLGRKKLNSCYVGHCACSIIRRRDRTKKAACSNWQTERKMAKTVEVLTSLPPISETV
jgi:hypothetical protein